MSSKGNQYVRLQLVDRDGKKGTAMVYNNIAVDVDNYVVDGEAYTLKLVYNTYVVILI